MEARNTSHNKSLLHDEAFSPWLAHVLASEGGYAFHPLDKGQETYKGISRKAHPDWGGWAKVDAAKHLAGAKTKQIDILLDDDPDLKHDIFAFYHRHYWEPYRSLPCDVTIRRKLADIAVNCGHKNAIKILQRALFSLGRIEVKADGILGPVTTKALAAASQGCPPYELVFTISHEQIAHYAGIVVNDPAQLRWLKGWLNRARYQGN